MIVNIDRSRWFRGLGEGTPLKFEDRFCVLGFIANECGCEELDGLETITDISTEDFIKICTRFGYDIMEHGYWIKQIESLNDDPDISDRKREKLLKKEFKKFAIDLKFK